MQRIKCSLQLIFLSFLVLLLSSCAPKNGQVTLNFDDQVEVDLSGGELQPGFSYFYNGSEAEPHTIIGIAGDVFFQQDLWQPATEGVVQVQRWLENIDNRHRSITDMYSGGTLVDGQGKMLGIWFSKYRFYSGFFTSDGKLVIRRPLRDKKTVIFER